jgi:hypothetical protein
LGSILDHVTMALSVAQSGVEAPLQESPSVDELAAAARDFLLRTVPDALCAAVTKLAVIDSDKSLWEAEVDVQVPNATVKALGLPTRRPVVDTETYLLRLDGRLKILAYSLKDSLDA